MFLVTWAILCTKILWLYLWHGKTVVFYKRALQLIRNENILFTKIFQSLANSHNVNFSPELQLQFQQYAANTSYIESEINYESLDEIESNYNVQIDRRVINSGMIALVFKGVDASGEQIIVKLKRKNITAHLQQGCDSITTLYQYAAYLFPNNIYVRVMKPFITNINDIIEQSDFIKEIANMKQAKEEFKPLTFIQIPTVYNKTMSETEYIIMEFIDGTHILPIATSEEERLVRMEQFGTFTSYSFLYNTIQHTDLHSGNILFTPNGLGIIDYGMAIHVNDETHEILLSIAAIIRDQTPLHEIDIIDTFKEFFSPPINKAELTDIQAVEDIIISIAQPLFDSIDVDELNITDNLSRLSEYMGREIVLNRDIYKIILGISMMTGKITIMGPHYPNSKLMNVERKALQNAYELIMT